MSEISIPEQELVDINLLTVDGDNPNKMTKRQRIALQESIRKYGIIIPIITNKDLLIADGQQTWEVARDYFKMAQVPVIRLDVDDIDRRMLRQVLNKLHGKHDASLDALEFEKILDVGRDKELRTMLDMTSQQMDKVLARLETGDTEVDVDEEPDEEITPDVTTCPACQFEFDPEVHKADFNLLVEDQGHIFESSRSIPTKAHGVVLNLDLETTHPEANERSIEVAKAFGIGIDESVKFTVFNTLEFFYNPEDLIYVTGDSGGGKSTLLRLFEGHLHDKGVSVANFGRYTPNEDEVVIDGVGEDADEAMRILSTAGLSEASLMIRRYDELSDGQKYRYRLAKLLSIEAQVYIIDEFCTSLDRVMAKVLAYSVQKWARRKGVMVVCATPHHDLIEDLNPEILIYKGLGQDVRVQYNDVAKKPMSLLKDIKLEKATVEDYHALEQFHYLHGDPPPVMHRFKLVFEGQKSPIGVVVYTSPFLAGSLRNKAMPQYKGTTIDKTELVNQDIIRLARIIVHPKFRGIGLGVKLVRDTMPLTEKRVVETIAAMAQYNPFFEKAGMVKVGKIPLSRAQRNLHNTVKRIGGNPALMFSPTERKTFIEGLSKTRKNALIEALTKSYKNISGQGDRGSNQAKRFLRELMNEGIQSLLGSLIGVSRVYLYWENPDIHT